tara:strand:- start:26055 stop:27026 length:972 start_codon:yes stop_codon:yes gene_type:complete
MKIITKDDFIDLFSKCKQRGIEYVLSKLTLNRLSRTKSSFNQSKIIHSNWWIIPLVRKRWNILITGKADKTYEEYMMTEVFQDKKKLKLLSIGSGSCSHEITLAKYDNFEEIVCVDLAQNRINEAKEIAKKLCLKKIKFVCEDIFKYKIEDDYYDIIFFHQSLHHIKKVDNFLKTKVSSWLKLNGNVVINEFVGENRMQLSKYQINTINKALEIIPIKYKSRFKTGHIKTKFYGSGILRMMLADPSECVDSSNIIKSLHKHFNPIVEKGFGGNIIMNVLKDISHHFVENNKEKEKILKKLFEFEDAYLKSNKSDFVFGIYQKK